MYLASEMCEDNIHHENVKVCECLRVHLMHSFSLSASDDYCDSIAS